MINQVWQLASREIMVGLKSKQFYVSMAISAIFIIGLVLFPKFIGGVQKPLLVEVKGDQTSASLFLENANVANVDFVYGSEESQNSFAASIEFRDTQAPVVTIDKASNASAINPVLSTVQSAAILSTDEATSLKFTQPEVVIVNDDSDRSIRVGLAYVISLILFLQISGLGGSVAQGTLEEKGNGVIDVLYAKVTPLRILLGKVLGIGIFGVLQMVALGIIGVITVSLAGDDSLKAIVTPLIVVSLGWFLVGYFFIAFLSAAVASTVVRADSLPTVMLPLQLLNGAVFVTAVLALQDMDAIWVQALSAVPPFSAILMPMRNAAATVPVEATVLSLAIGCIAIALVAALGARTYQRSIIRKK